MRFRAHGNLHDSLVEITLVLLTGVAHLIFEELLHAKGAFIAGAALFWTGFVMLRVRHRPGMWREWGFTAQGMLRASIAPTIFFAIAALSIAIFAAARGSLRLHWHLAVLLAAYPLWGIVQQFLIQALVVRNLAARMPGKRARIGIAVIGALLFSAVHWPDPVLMGATALLGAAFIPMYLRRPCLWPLGLYHGWLGAITYFWVLDRNPVMEIFCYR